MGGVDMSWDRMQIDAMHAHNAAFADVHVL